MVTWSLDGGANPRVVQKDAGHSSLQTTMGYAQRNEQVTGERVTAMAKAYARVPVDPAEPDRRSSAEPRDVVDEPAVLAWLASQDPAVVGEILVRAMRGESTDRHSTLRRADTPRRGAR